jgi:hypothetical protein
MTCPQGLIRIDVEPVTGDGPLYYRTMISHVEADSSGTSTSTVRDIFHTDSVQIAVEILRATFGGDKSAE